MDLTAAHRDIQSRQLSNNDSRSVLSKYYSRPSWVSSDESGDSSDNDSHLDISTVHLTLANQHTGSNLSQLTEDSYPQFDVDQNRRLHLRQQSVANELEGENQGGVRQHRTGESEQDQQQANNRIHDANDENGNDHQQQEVEMHQDANDNNGNDQ